jgi:acetyl esterase/lipase
LNLETTMRIIASLLLFSTSTLLGGEAKVQRDLPYTEPKNALQTLDVYALPEGENHPVVIWIHGGGWHSGDKKDVGSKPQAFVDRGFVFMTINYRLWPSVTIQQIAGDVAKAIRWSHDHARSYGGDPKTLFIMGHSAGAQLAALVCTDDRYLKAEELSLAIVKGCVPVDGDTFDLPMRIATVHKSGNKKLAERDKQRFGNEKNQKELSSVTYIARGTRIPPFLVLHVAEHPDTSAQAQRLGNVLKDAGVPATVFGARDTDHNKINADLGLPNDPATRVLFEFLKKALKK